MTGSTTKLFGILAFVLGVATVPHRVCERDAGAWFDGEPAKVEALAAQVESWIEPPPAPSAFATGSPRFDDEWTFGTLMMAAMGFGQIALEHPERRAESLARMERCLEGMLTADVSSFDRDAWSEDPIASLEGTRGHMAYLGYTGIALGLHRTLAPTSRFSELDDRFVAAIARRIDASPTGLVETYPKEVYPVDNASALAALALRARATGRAPPPALARGLRALRDRGIDPSSGLLFQSVDLAAAAPRDVARASGTALASYFLAYADPDLSRSLFAAIDRRQFRTVLGFGAILEYGSGHGAGDVDSGAMLFGFGVSATGFALGASRANGERDRFTALYATTHLFGAPVERSGRRGFATGGPLGDAILLAMMTAPSARRPG